MERFEKIATLDNEIEALRVRGELEQRGIPFAMRSYYDLAYDGLFQFSGGWGHVEAQAEHRDEILEIIEVIRDRSVRQSDEMAEQEDAVASAVKPHADTDDVAASAQDDRQREVCPRCGSVAVREEFSHAAVLQWLAIWPFLPVRRRWSCEECGHSWKRLKW